MIDPIGSRSELKPDRRPCDHLCQASRWSVIRERLNLLVTDSFPIRPLEKAAFVQFTNEAIVDDPIEIDLSEAGILRFQQALYIAHSIERGIELPGHGLHYVMVAFLSGEIVFEA